MPATLVFTYAGTPDYSGESRKSPRVSEIWKITSDSAAVGDTGDLTPSVIKRIQGVIGPVSMSIADLETGVATLTTAIALTSSDCAFVEVIGYP